MSLTFGIVRYDHPARQSRRLFRLTAGRTSANDAIWISYIDDLHATAVCCDIRDTVAYAHALRNPNERHRTAGGGVRWIADIDNLEILMKSDQVGSLPSYHTPVGRPLLHLRAGYLER
jgi:hypothetical protein